MVKKAYYIADISLPSDRAYAIHVINMCNALSKQTKNLELIIFFSQKKASYKYLKNLFMLNGKKFKITSIFNDKLNNSFIMRLIFGYKSAKFVQGNSLIITRSFYSSFFLTLFKKKHYLEIHQALAGLTKIIFNKLKFLKSDFIIRTIFISKKLKNYFNGMYLTALVLPDAVDVDVFKKNKIKKSIKQITYVGSFYRGKGAELVYYISKHLPSIQFNLYGKRNDDKFKYKSKNNVKIHNFVKYKKVPKILAKSDIVLLPLDLKYVSINSSGRNINIAKFTSPLKMFEYLSSGIPLISSNLKVLQEVLINKNNSYIAKDNTVDSWVEAITTLKNNFELRKTISKNAIKTAKKFTWEKRVKKIISNYNILNK
jgi:glycosyltransferase involved in cell wall biosynthesis